MTVREVQVVRHVKALFKVTIITGLCHDVGTSGEIISYLICQGTIHGDNNHRVCHDVGTSSETCQGTIHGDNNHRVVP